MVDDEPLNLQLVRNVLHADYRLIFAKDGRSALTLASTVAPDLILGADNFFDRRAFDPDDVPRYLKMLQGSEK